MKVLGVVLEQRPAILERILPRLAGCLEPDGALLVWAGEAMEAVMEREAWRRYRFVERRALPGRDRSWVWLFA